LDSRRVHFDALFGNEVPKKRDLLHIENAFLEFNVKAVFDKLFQDETDMLFVFFL
jgi:hypothetical protein